VLVVELAANERGGEADVTTRHVHYGEMKAIRVEGATDRGGRRSGPARMSADERALLRVLRAASHRD